MGAIYRFDREEDTNPTPEQITLKKSVRERIIKARMDGVPSGRIANAMKSKSIHVLYDLLEAKRYPMEAWEDADEALKMLGY